MSRETQGLFLATPQLDARLLQIPGVLKAAQFYAEHFPRYIIEKGVIPDPNILGPRGRLIHVSTAGICGSDINMMRLAMDVSATIDLPNVPPAQKTLFLQLQQIIGKRFLGWNPEDQRIIAKTELGHEIFGTDENDRLVIVYTKSNCSKFDDQHMRCPMCLSGHENHCQYTNRGPVRGMGVGVGRRTKDGQNLGAGLSEWMITYDEDLIYPPSSITKEQAVLTDVVACGFNAVETAMEHVPNLKPETPIMVVGGGMVGFATLIALNDLGFKNIHALTKYKEQAEHVEKFGYTPVMLDSNGYRTGTFNQQFPLVFEAVGSRRSLSDSISFAHPLGCVVEVGLPHNVNPDHYLQSRNGVGTLPSFWATKRHYQIAIDALMKIPETCQEIVFAGHSLKAIKEALFPHDRKHLKHAVRFY
jgi:threonine dehydrogenase-like Zn-dependent dehydrogenase